VRHSCFASLLFLFLCHSCVADIDSMRCACHHLFSCSFFSLSNACGEGLMVALRMQLMKRYQSDVLSCLLCLLDPGDYGGYFHVPFVGVGGVSCGKGCKPQARSLQNLTCSMMCRFTSACCYFISSKKEVGTSGPSPRKKYRSTE
jgi:hypothetical protein